MFPDDRADDQAAAKSSPLSRYETMEQAKQVLARDRRTAFETARNNKRRQIELHRQETLAIEEDAREQMRRSKETTDEHAARLMEEMRTSVIKRFEVDLYATARANVTREFDTTIKAGLKKTIRNEVYQNLYAELQPVIEAELASKLYQLVKENLEQELRPIIEAQIRIDAQESMKKAELGQDTAQSNSESEQPQQPNAAKETQSILQGTESDTGVEKLPEQDAVQATADALDVAENGDQVDLVNETYAPNEVADTPVHTAEGPRDGYENPLKRSLEGDQDSPQSPSKRSKGDNDHNLPNGDLEREPLNEFTSVAQRDGMGSIHYPSLEGRVPETDSERSRGSSEIGEEGAYSNDLPNGENYMDEDGQFDENQDELEDTEERRKMMGYRIGPSDDVEEESDEAHDEHRFERMDRLANEAGRFYEDEDDDDEIDYSEDEAEHDSEEDEDDVDDEEEGAMAHEPEPVIAISNTQDTAFVIDDSDEDVEGEGGGDGEGEEDEEGGSEDEASKEDEEQYSENEPEGEEAEDDSDADKTLVVETEVIRTVYTKSFPGDEPETAANAILHGEEVV